MKSSAMSVSRTIEGRAKVNLYLEVGVTCQTPEEAYLSFDNHEYLCK